MAELGAPDISTLGTVQIRQDGQITHPNTRGDTTESTTPGIVNQFSQSTEAAGGLIVARATFIPPRTPNIVPADEDAILKYTPTSERVQQKRSAGETALAVTNLALFLQKEVEKHLPATKKTREITRHFKEILSNKPDTKYMYSATRREKEKKLFHAKGVPEGKYYVSHPGSVEQACIIIAKIAREKTWGEDISISMLKTVDTLLTKYRLQDNLAREYLPEMPDLVRELNDTLEVFSGKKGENYQVRREIYNILDQLPIQKDEAERTLWIMDNDARDLSHPYSFQATLSLMRDAPSCGWVTEQQRRHEKLISEFLTKTPEELFLLYDQLSEVADHIVIQPGSGTNILGKIGMELECTLSAETHDQLHSGWEPEDMGDYTEIRRSDTELTYDQSYVLSLASLSHFMRDTGKHFQGFHFHLDQTVHPIKPDIAGLLSNSSGSAIADNPLDTWEVRAIWPPSVSWHQARPNPADIAHLVNLHILASTEIDQSVKREFLHVDETQRVSLHQAIFAHIARYIDNPDTRFASLMALKHPLALNSVNVASLVNNFDADSKPIVLKQLFYTQMSNVQKRQCLSLLFPKDKPLDGQGLQMITSMMQDVHAKNLEVLLDQVSKMRTIPDVLQQKLWSLFTECLSEKKNLQSQMNGSNDGTESTIHSRHKHINSVLTKVKSALIDTSWSGTADTPTVVALLQNESTSMAVADLIEQWKIPDDLLQSLISLLTSDSDLIRTAVGKVLSNKKIPESAIPVILNMVNEENPSLCETALKLLRAVQIPENSIDSIIALSQSDKAKSLRIAAVTALSSTKISEIQKLSILSHINKFDPSEFIIQSVILASKENPTEAVFDTLISSAQDILQNQASQVLETYKIAFSPNFMNIDTQRQVKLAEKIASSSITASHVFFSTLEQIKQLDQTTISALITTASSAQENQLNNITQLLARQILQTPQEIPQYAEDLFQNANSDVLCGLLSAFERMNAPYDNPLLDRVKKLVHHQDVRVVLATLKLSESRKNNAFVTSEDLFQILSRIDANPSQESLSPILEREWQQRKVQAEEAEARKKRTPDISISQPISIPRRSVPTTLKAMPMNIGGERMPRFDMFKKQTKMIESRVLEYPHRFETDYISSNIGHEKQFNDGWERVDYLIDEQYYRRSQNVLPEYVLYNSKLSVPPKVAALDLQREIIRNQLISRQNLTETQCDTLIQFYETDPYKHDISSLLQLLVRQHTLSDHTIDQLFTVVKNTESLWRYSLETVLHRPHPTAHYYEQVLSLVPIVKQEQQAKIFHYFAEHSDLPDSITTFLESHIHDTEDKIVSLSLRALLRQPVVRDDLYARVMEYCDSPSDDLNTRAEVFRALRFQSHLSEDMLIWCIPDEFGAKPFKYANYVKDIMEKQATMSDVVYERLFNAAVKSYYAEGERILGVLQSQEHIPQQLVSTMLQFVQEEKNNPSTRYKVTQILMREQTLNDTQIEQLFTYMGGQFDLSKDMIRYLAPQIKDNAVLFHCMEPSTYKNNAATDEAFKVLQRINTLPQEFLQHCIEMYDTYHEHIREEVLHMLANQAHLSKGIIAQVTQMNARSKQAEKYKKYVEWKYSLNPIKSLIARTRTADMFHF